LFNTLLEFGHGAGPTQGAARRDPNNETERGPRRLAASG